MFFLKSEIEFDAAHYLANYNGKCNNIHGHRYKVIATFKSNDLKDDMVEDFGNIKALLKDIEKVFDHKLIIEKNDEGIKLKKSINNVKNFEIELVEYRPTAERMAKHIYQILKQKNNSIYEVEIFETPTNRCVYREE